MSPQPVGVPTPAAKSRFRALGCRGKEGGFSLIEVLVAFTILALSLGIIYRVFGQGLRVAGLSTEYSRAVIHAQSQLARLGVEPPVDEALLAGPHGGQLADGYRWRAELIPFEPTAPNLGFSEGGLEPLTIRVRVSWETAGRVRFVELHTVRLRVPS